MRREKSPGLKILWLWTIGTAAVLVASVVRTRMRDMEDFMKADQQQQQTTTPTDSVIVESNVLKEDE
ncbi:hypothetical protein FNV43_RR02900 [Rhamnella rubrinervis]|uniref:Uncharacterized protein n=1 Tax=Rhamnella rubrinervis TaxID=2594499 RepID=A0A8K0MND7_9ROSA|nr:hypothetical protein FNV43_RR02900 [Rhamnella rubrinervis]